MFIWLYMLFSKTLLLLTLLLCKVKTKDLSLDDQYNADIGISVFRLVAAENLE